MIPFRARARSLSLHLRRIYTTCARAHGQPLRETSPGKLNQRISRIYRQRAIPRILQMHGSRYITSCRIFLEIHPPRLRLLSEEFRFHLFFVAGGLHPRFVRKSSPPGITDLSTSFPPLPRNSPAICYRSLSRSTLNGRTLCPRLFRFYVRASYCAHTHLAGDYYCSSEN